MALQIGLLECKLWLHKHNGFQIRSNRETGCVATCFTIRLQNIRWLDTNTCLFKRLVVTAQRASPVANNASSRLDTKCLLHLPPRLCSKIFTGLTQTCLLLSKTWVVAAQRASPSANNAVPGLTQSASTPASAAAAAAAAAAPRRPAPTANSALAISNAPCFGTCELKNLATICQQCSSRGPAPNMSAVRTKLATGNLLERTGFSHAELAACENLRRPCHMPTC